MRTYTFNISEVCRSTGYQAYELKVSDDGIPYLFGWHRGAEDYEIAYLDRDTVEVLFQDRSFMRKALAMAAWSKTHSCMDLNCPELYYHVGTYLASLAKDGLKYVFLRGSEVSLDRMVQL
jgi:hypothetical protein